MSDTKWKDYTVKMHITRSQVIEDLTKLHSCDLDGLKLLLMKYAIKDPKSGCDLTEPEKFNLMFSTELGPYTTSKTRGYLRPETSQGIFVNFKRLLDYNHGRVPFAAAQIGNAFRNEINPRGLLRVREFTIAEIEHFTDPEDKTHPKFKSISDIELTLYSRCHQSSKQKPIRMKILDAVSQGLIKSETFGYFLIRIQEFLLRVGISADRLRFRQHSVDEMAHYAEYCWDAECLTSHGWIECVGCADRTDYDLLKHATATRSNLKYKKPLKKSIEREEIKVAARSSFLKSLNKTEQNAIKSRLERITTPEELDDFKKSLECESNKQELIENVVVSRSKKTVQFEEVFPHVIEPSFGIGRILYALLEHSFRKRPDGDKNSYFAIPPLVAPYKCAILPLVQKNVSLEKCVRSLSTDLTSNEISHQIDNFSGSIGKRYIRCDEIGIPFSITVDYSQIYMTIRDRDTKEQLRIPMGDMSQVVRDLCTEKINWDELEED